MKLSQINIYSHMFTYKISFVDAGALEALELV